jgi:ABC-type antimicrobial peptide transport system permease subunit
MPTTKWPENKERKMSKKETSSNGASGGIGFIGLLTIAFVVLKLTKVIAWSWLWVLSPLWIAVGIFIIAMLAGVIIAVVVNKK